MYGLGKEDSQGQENPERYWHLRAGQKKRSLQSRRLLWILPSLPPYPMSEVNSRAAVSATANHRGVTVQKTALGTVGPVRSPHPIHPPPNILQMIQILLPKCILHSSNIVCVGEPPEKVWLKFWLKTFNPSVDSNGLVCSLQYYFCTIPRFYLDQWENKKWFHLMDLRIHLSSSIFYILKVSANFFFKVC